MLAVYFIHLPFNFSRYQLISQAVDRVGGELWPGSVDRCLFYDEYLVEKPTVDRGTLGATRAHMSLYEHFLYHRREPYLMVFEDDIYFHRDFDTVWNRLPEILDEMQPKLLYLGSGDPAMPIDERKRVNQFTIGRIPLNLRISGGFGVIISREVIDELLVGCRSCLESKLPHDKIALGDLQQTYNDDALMIYPNPVIADVTASHIRKPRNLRQYSNKIGWALSEYPIPPKVVVFVVVNRNLERLRRFNAIFTIFQPSAIPVFLIDRTDTVVARAFDSDEFRSLLRVEIEGSITETVAKASKEFTGGEYAEVFGLTNIRINFTFDVSRDWWPKQIKLLNRYDQLVFRIRRCRLCDPNPEKIRRLKSYQGFSLFHSRIDGRIKRVDKRKIKIVDSKAFTTHRCFRSDLGDLHNLCLDDLIEELDDRNPLRSVEGTVFETDPDRWLSIFETWWDSHFETVVNEYLPEQLQLHDFSVSAEISAPVDTRNKFNQKSFRVHRFGVDYQRFSVRIVFGLVQLTSLFGRERVRKISALLHKQKRPTERELRISS